MKAAPSGRGTNPASGRINAIYAGSVCEKPSQESKLVTMTIQEQVDHDLKEAMRARDAGRLSALRMAKAALMNAAIEKYGAGGKLADAEAIAVIRKQVKQRQDAIASFDQGGRPELAQKEQQEIAYL